MTGYAGLTPALAEEAFRLARPSIEQVASGSDGHLVILEPGHPPAEKQDLPVLFSWSWGHKSNWAAPYQAIAESKARVSWATGLPSHRVQQEYAYLYRPGWTKWGGSAVGEGGLVAAYSGQRWFYDQFFSELVVSAIKAVAQRELERVVSDDRITFLGELEPP